LTLRTGNPRTSTTTLRQLTLTIYFHSIETTTVLLALAPRHREVGLALLLRTPPMIGAKVSVTGTHPKTILSASWKLYWKEQTTRTGRLNPSSREYTAHERHSYIRLIDPKRHDLRAKRQLKHTPRVQVRHLTRLNVRDIGLPPAREARSTRDIRERPAQGQDSKSAP
jgi:hypothetical protein